MARSWFRRLFGGKDRAHRGTGSGFLSEEEVADFVDLEQPLFVASSNVGMAQYFGGEQRMLVEFLNGSAYSVYPISREEAESFARAPSKGGWYWDRVRVRGTKDEHQKTVTRLR